MAHNINNNDPEGFPYSLQRGNLANLSALRGTDAETRAAFFEGRNTNRVALEAETPAVLLDAPIPVKCLIAFGGGGCNDGIEEDKNEEDKEEPEPETATPPETILGEIFVTNTQVLFVAAEDANMDSDVAIGGACVILHAMTEDPEPSVYLQLSPPSGDDTVSEMTLVPLSGEEDCQTLFDALCKLISLHPLIDENGDGEGGLMSGGMIGGGFGDNPFGNYGEMVWAGDDDESGAVTSQEREQMLERLDNLLVVAPGLEAKEEQEEDDDDGRFDDASEA